MERAGGEAGVQIYQALHDEAPFGSGELARCAGYRVDLHNSVDVGRQRRRGLPGERHLVSSAGAQAVRWRRDGKELFYLGFDGRVQAVPVRLSERPEFGAATALFTISTEARAVIHSVLGFDVSADGSRFVIVKAAESPSLVVVQNWQALLDKH